MDPLCTIEHNTLCSYTMLFSGSQGSSELLTDIVPPCAPWCTMQVGGAHCRLVVHNVVLYRWGSAQHSSHKPRQTLRLTILHCTPYCEWFLTNMQNSLVHHLTGTKLCCALPKCMSALNYIVNLDLHIRYKTQKYYMPLCATCVCSLSTSHKRRPPLGHHGAQHKLMVHNVVTRWWKT